MASLTTSLPPPLFLQGRKTLFRTLQNLPVSSTGETQNCAVIVKATSDSSESSTSLSIVKSVQNIVSFSLSEAQKHIFALLLCSKHIRGPGEGDSKYFVQEIAEIVCLNFI
ncbi:hypothetical protein CRYUN_Cryun37aG0048200 [Craigia yunnanensis]